MQRQAQVPGSFLRQEILKCAEALKEGKDKTEVAAKLASLSADSYAEQASIDVSYNISMGCFVAKPSVTGKGM